MIRSQTSSVGSSEPRSDPSESPSADNYSHDKPKDNGEGVETGIDTPRISQNTDSTDDSDGGRNGTGLFNARSRQRRRAQGSSTSAPDQARTDSDSASRAQQRGGGSKGGSTLHIPCKFFKHGNCTAGTGCYFSHDINMYVDKAPCKYFSKGNCRYGNKCALMHIGQNDGMPVRSQKANNGGQQRNQQNRPTSGNAPGRNNLRSGLNSGSTPKKDRKGSSDASYSDATAGRSGALGDSRGNGNASNLASALAQGYGQQGAGGAHTHSTASAVSSSSVQDDRTSGVNSSDSSATNKKPNNPWATGSVASKLLRDREPRVSPSAVQNERRRFADSGANEPGSAGMRGADPRARPGNADGGAPEYLLAGDQYNGASLSPLHAHYEHSRASAAAAEGEINSRSQPIPKPSASSFSRALRGNNSLPYGGLSMQESMLIDNLALSYGAANQSFAGSPFVASSIPLLDHFKDVARGETISTGTSPHAHSFTRSPMLGGSGFLLNRHAFSAVDSMAQTHDAPDGELGSGGNSLRQGYHGHLQSQHLDMSPAIHPSGGAQSIPHTSDIFGRSLRSSSLANEPLSPLSSFAGMNGDLADSGAQAAFMGSPAATGVAPGSGRLRANSNTMSPSIAGFSSGLEYGSAGSGLATASGATRMSDAGALLSGESRLAAYSLNDAQSLPYGHPLESGNGLWDSLASAYPSANSARDSDPRYALGSRAAIGQRAGAGTSLGQQAGSLSNYYQQASSPFASAIGSLGDHRQQTGQSRMAFGSPTGEGPLPGAIGQRPQQPHGGAFGAAPGGPRSYPYAGGLASSFGGIGSSMFAIEASRAQNTSGNGSSAASDNIDELFELEQDVPAQSRTNSNNSLAPNPAFISIDGFSNKFSGLSLNRSEGSGGSLAQSASGSRSISSISAIARPAA